MARCCDGAKTPRTPDIRKMRRRLLIELEGLAESVEESGGADPRGVRKMRLREVRVARTAEERDLLWKGRKNAFWRRGARKSLVLRAGWRGARTQIAPTLRRIAEVSAKYGSASAISSTPGDGNMHPIILFNSHVPGELEKARARRRDSAVVHSAGGSITGEHGVGMEKNEMSRICFRRIAECMARLKALFDPSAAESRKMLPTGKAA